MLRRLLVCAIALFIFPTVAALALEERFPFEGQTVQDIELQGLRRTRE